MQAVSHKVKPGITGLCGTNKWMAWGNWYIGKNGNELSALIYTTNPHVIELVKVFIIHAIMAGEATQLRRWFREFCAATRTRRYISRQQLVYWARFVSFPFLDYKFNNGAFVYWQSLDIGVICSVVVLSLCARSLAAAQDKEVWRTTGSGVSRLLFYILKCSWGNRINVRVWYSLGKCQNLFFVGKQQIIFSWRMLTYELK